MTAHGQQRRRPSEGRTAADRPRAERPVATSLLSTYPNRDRTLGARTKPWLTPGGRAEHAGGIAKDQEARESVRDAVVTLERVRGHMRKQEPEEALRWWRALVDARWSVVDQFDSDGRRYIIAKRNEAAETMPRQLSPRERQVLAYANLGHSNKAIACDLGLSASTVRVLLARASRKLGVKGRQLVLDRYRLVPCQVDVACRSGDCQS